MIKNLFSSKGATCKRYCLVSLILGLIYAFPAYSEVCFLPSGGCQSDMTMAATSQATVKEDCSKYSGSKYFPSSTGSVEGATCKWCDDKYYCECTDNEFIKSGDSCVEKCPSSVYQYDYKPSPWQCTDKCSYTGIANSNKYKTCTCPGTHTRYTSGGVEKCANCSAYTINATEAATKRSNSYTCDPCDDNEASGKYQCSCPSPKEVVNVGGVDKCLDKCSGNHRVHSTIDGSCGCANEYPNSYNGNCYATCTAPKSKFERGECKCADEYNHTKAADETCTGTPCDGKYREGDCSTTCAYTYRQVSPSDAHGLTSGGGTGVIIRNCVQGSDCYKSLAAQPSIYLKGGTPDLIVYNRISKDSAVCTATNPTTYGKICEGVPEETCTSDEREFHSNGCESERYHHGFEVYGAKWGSCEKNCKGGFNTLESCRETTYLPCARKIGSDCFATCNYLKYPGSEAECKAALGGLSGTCQKIDDCYKPVTGGFTLKLADDAPQSCNISMSTPYGGSVTITTSSQVYLLNYGDKKTVTPLNSVSPYLDSHSEVLQYPAGRYYLCHGTNRNGPINVTNSSGTYYTVILRSVQLRDLSEGDHFQCFTPERSTLDRTDMCELPNYYPSASDNACRDYEFEEGKEYQVNWTFSFTGGVPDYGTVNCDGNVIQSGHQ